MTLTGGAGYPEAHLANGLLWSCPAVWAEVCLRPTECLGAAL